MGYAKNCLSLGLLCLSAIGCARNPQGLWSDLPVHGLDLHAHGGPGNLQRPSPHAAPRADWAVSGARTWKYIVIHHSASDAGNAAVFDAAHRARGWDELGYHFVIDNGRGGSDGSVEVGSRWRSQKWGAHTGGTPDNEYNNHGIGICLVGDFSDHLPSAAQLASLRQLVVYLMRTYDIPESNIIGHRDAPDATTACPGDALHAEVVGRFRSEVRAEVVATK